MGSRHRHLREVPAERPKPAPFRFQAALAGVFAADADAATDVGPKWVQVTSEGVYAGYANGTKPFQMSRADLNQMVANLRAHPSYEVDAAGNPIGHVIPWDYNHASEMPATDGDLPVVGAPAQAWTLDFEVRNGPDGKAQLWALTEFLEPARTYVKTGKYKWASVSAVFNATDPISGQNVGSLVSSIALTNTPFVEGMEALVASKNPAVGKGKPGQQPEDVQLYRRTFYESARSPQDAINCMKEMFGLAETAGAQEVLLELGKVQQWYATGQAPIGTDPEYIIGSLRTILNLPALELPADVLTYALATVPALIADQSIQVGVPAPAAVAEGGNVPPVPMPTMAARRQQPEENVMSEILKTLATKLGVIQSDAAVLSAVDDLLSLHKGLCEIVSLGATSNSTVLLDASKKGKAAADKLRALVAALGVEDPDASVAKVADLMATAAKLKEVMPELEGLRGDKKKRDEADIETDVADAIAANKFPPDLKDALLLYRKTDPKGFAEKYPKQAAAAPAAGATGDKAAQLLTRGINEQINAGKGPQQVQQGGERINLAVYSGANPTARAKAHLSKTVPNWDKLDNDTQFKMALDLKRQPNVVDEPVAQA